MQKVVDINGKPVVVSLSGAAERALALQERPLEVEMELYFSCMIRMKVRFRESKDGQGGDFSEMLKIKFRPVTTAVCGVADEELALLATDFPMKTPDAFVPRWLEIDYRRGEWSGEFGFTRK